MGNTILVVGQDEETIRSADYLVDLGPGGGRFGGEIVSAGSLQDVMNTPNSITGKYLTGELRIDYPNLEEKEMGKSSSSKERGATILRIWMSNFRSDSSYA